MAKSTRASLNYSLAETSEGLALCLDGCAPITVDFESVVKQRLKQGIKKPGILKACKLEPHLTVLDATAGFGKDAALLASTGAKVLMCERESILQKLLRDGLKRLTPESGLNLQLIEDDAIHYLSNLPPENYPDVIYLDPMHPERRKSARVKKDLHALQQLLGEDAHAERLLTSACAHAKLRVVVKWPAKQHPLREPNYTVEGKTVRFDVYLAGIGQG